MSLLGKILAFFNVFGVAGLLCMAALDYGKRHTWAHAVFREDLAIQGLPLDSTETDMEGHSIAERINEQTKKELFPKDPVTTQTEEVQRVQAEVKREAAKPEHVGRKGLAFYATFLIPFARTYSFETEKAWAERERLRAYQTYLADDKVADGLKKKFAEAWLDALRPQPPGETKLQLREAVMRALDARHLETARPFVEDVLPQLPPETKDLTEGKVAQVFDQALEVQRTNLEQQLDSLFKQALAPSKSPEMRRQRIAFLLFNVYGSLEEVRGAPPDPEKNLEDVYRRYFTVVGLQQGAPAVQEEAADLVALTFEVEKARGRERHLFAAQHEKLLAQIRDRAAQVEALNALLLRKQRQQVAHEEELKKRKRDVKQLVMELETSQKATEERLKVLRQMSASLFQERIKLRNATEKNQELEKEVRQLEVER